MTRWTCQHCGCLHIASCLDVCPHCYTLKGEDVPKISKQHGASNRYEAKDHGDVPEELAEDVVELFAELAEAEDAAKHKSPVRAIPKPKPPVPAVPRKPRRGTK